MRIIGCILIFLWISILGFQRKWKLEQKCTQWKTMGLFLQLMREELKSTMKSTEQLILSAQKRCCDLELLHYYDEAEGTAQQRLFYAAEKLADPPMRELSFRLAQRLGTSPADIQLESLHSMELQCQQEWEHHRETAGKEGSLAVSMSLLCGAAVAIILL